MEEKMQGVNIDMITLNCKRTVLFSTVITPLIWLLLNNGMHGVSQ